MQPRISTHPRLVACCLLVLVAGLAGCLSNYTLKNPYLPTTIAVDSAGPRYLHNISQIKYWDRITTADQATGFAWWDSAGHLIEMNDLFNKIIVLNFFGTWSSASRHQLAVLDSVRREVQDSNVVFMAASQRETTTGGKAVVLLDSFARANNIDYQLLVGSRDFGFCYGGIDVVPTTFVITKKRKISSTFEGEVGAAALMTALNKAAARP